MGDFPNKETQFEKGECGNPNGRPKGTRNRSTIIREFLNRDIEWEDIDGKPKKLQVIEAMTAEQIKKAIKNGDTSAFNAVLNHGYGNPEQELKHSGVDGEPITAVVWRIDGTDHRPSSESGDSVEGSK